MARKNTTKIQAAIKATLDSIVSEGRYVLTDNDLELLRKFLGRTPTQNNILNFVAAAFYEGIDRPTEFLGGLGKDAYPSVSGTYAQFPEKGEDGKWRFSKQDSSVGAREAVSRATPSAAEKDLKNVNRVFGDLPVRTTVANLPVKPLNVTEEGAHLIVQMMNEEAKNKIVNLPLASPRVLDRARPTLRDVDTKIKVPLFNSPVSGPLTKIKLLHDALLSMETDAGMLHRSDYVPSPRINTYRTYLEESPTQFLPRIPRLREVREAFRSGRMTPEKYYAFISELRMGLEKMFPDMLTGMQSLEDNARVLSHALHQAGFLVDGDPSLIETKRGFIKTGGVFNPTGGQLHVPETNDLLQRERDMLSHINNGGLSVPVGRSETTGKVVFAASGAAPIQYKLNDEKATQLPTLSAKEVFKGANSVVSIAVVNDIAPLSPRPDRLLLPPPVGAEDTTLLPAPVEAGDTTSREPKQVVSPPVEEEEDGRKRKKTPLGRFTTPRITASLTDEELKAYEDAQAKHARSTGRGKIKRVGKAFLPGFLGASAGALIHDDAGAGIIEGLFPIGYAPSPAGADSTITGAEEKKARIRGFPSAIAQQAAEEFLTRDAVTLAQRGRETARMATPPSDRSFFEMD